MKTIEEKAEAYDMAIEGIQEILSSGEDSIKMSRLRLRLQGIFPEIKETEDERIEKEILDYCKTKAEKYPNDPKYKNISKWIAWVEKRGKLIEEYEEKLDRCACENFNKGYKAATEHQKEKQGEQWKPTQEQLDALKQQLEIVGNIPWQYQITKELYNQLKEL